MNPAIKGLGETVLRVRDLDSMKAFYANIIGLELIKEFPKVAFFKIAEGFGGHTQVIGLFAEELPRAFVNDNTSTIEPACSSLHHFALEISSEDYSAEKTRLENAGCEVITAEHQWCQWRSIYVKDPENNVVELVCYDKSVV
ncbi:VOC family protein [Pseudoalteromonas sp. G4]|uniref:VOC family protein n=1 Tax=Pseudoalteromonas sp. G4 TaxID=2992761 RepID=UPI00237DE717|nr:VOC family protein [Pseudoalteromonas sp. G4]MDE3270842.1 VOC family protein [Pseudoalteromonas sp. G4]